MCPDGSFPRSYQVIFTSHHQMDAQSCCMTTAGRVSSRITGDFVVFILGAHMNSLTAFFAYKKIGYLMQGMLSELVVRAQPANQE